MQIWFISQFFQGDNFWVVFVDCTNHKVNMALKMFENLRRKTYLTSLLEILICAPEDTRKVEKC